MRQSDTCVSASKDVRGDIIAVFSHFLKIKRLAIDPQTCIESFALKYHKQIACSQNKNASRSSVINFQKNVSNTF